MVSMPNQQREQRLLEIELLQRSVYNVLLQLTDPDAAIEQALAIVGEALNVSRAYVFHFQANERYLDNTHEWCAPDIKPEISNLKGLPFDDMVPSFFPMLQQHGLIAPTHIQELPEDVQAILAPQNIQSILHMPFYVNGRLQGFIGFDENRESRQWLPEEIATLRVLVGGYARALERIDFEHRLIQARTAALHSLRSQDEFIATISHELRTPLTGIVGMLELLSESTLTDEQSEFVGIAKESAHGLASIIDATLDFTRLDMGHLVLDNKPVDLRGIIAELVTTLTPRLHGKPVALKTVIADDVPHRLWGDANRIRQLLINLLDNAIKFTEAGEVVLQIQHLSTLTDRARLRFEVRDTGIGIPANQLERIFDSFVQVDQSPTRRYGGLGLGLKVVKQLATLMGGEVSVESEVGQGSQFYCTLAFSLVPSAVWATIPYRTVWVIDSDDTNRYVVSQQLRLWGFIVTEIERIQGDVPMGELPDVVVYHVTARDGMTVLSTLRRYFQDSILLCLDDGDNVEVRGEDFDGRLIRPLTEDQFRSALQPRSALTERPSAHQHCLVVDDNHEVCLLIQRILEREGIKATVLHDGKQALKALETGFYDLILMDVQMPGMGGIEATRYIRSRVDTKGLIPIIILTGSAQESDEIAQHGINAVLSKPFTPQQLRQLVRQWLPSQ